MPTLYHSQCVCQLPKHNLFRINDELTNRTPVGIVTSMNTYITYLRVSTKQQGASGLGLEAQRASVAQFARESEIAAEYVEVESGKNDKRPQLAAALAHAKKIKATLLVAKLDRLGRNVLFIAQLMAAKVDFVAVDMPHANKMTIQMMAVIAEWERDQIAARTKAALAAAKARGVKLGGPDPRAAAAKWSDQAQKRAAPAAEIARGMVREGSTLAAVGQALQAKGIRTARGGQIWSPKQVSRLL